MTAADSATIVVLKGGSGREGAWSGQWIGTAWTSILQFILPPLG